jgi:hypothetical protein
MRARRSRPPLLWRALRAWKVPRASVYRSLNEAPDRPSLWSDRACSDAELAGHTRQQIDANRLLDGKCISRFRLPSPSELDLPSLAVFGRYGGHGNL